MRRVSDYAAQYLGPDDEPDDEPINVDPARSRGARPPPRHTREGEFTRYVLDRQAEARARIPIYARKAWIALIRAVLAFFASFLPVPHWLGFALFWVSVLFGYLALEHWREYRVARIQSTLWPY